MNSTTLEPEFILDFWFSEENRSAWFNSTIEMDERITDKFSSIYQLAHAMTLPHWRETAPGCLALAIVLDQFPLNMFRGKAESFQSEKQAIEITYFAVGEGFDQQLPVEQRVFLYMPLMHSEKLVDQNNSVDLFAASGLEDNLRFAKHHRKIIREFGRFPHRNKILGRRSSASELAYLESKGAFTG